MTTASRPDRLFLLEELRGPKCRCGAEKKPKLTFCRTCYFLLPISMRQALYNRFGEGYELAYLRAVEFLTRGTGREERLA